eukprot:CAMPEP_0119378314 /NCGR_PEP_ID=MMETSP1334-20130426/47801_1 /TAXON_ID=127549 /ORGANISM="Calcidiscus leptoporus, Strain RCC1130" /LENGTH=44 /DNA_ID= /DNA_START= /DNA_END= /DNA_ORIENTATION=
MRLEVGLAVAIESTAFSAARDAHEHMHAMKHALKLVPMLSCVAW